MTTSVVRIARSEGYSVSPRGVHLHFPQGDYRVPDDMPADVARRAIESGIGTEVRTKDTKPETKRRAPRKKKRALSAKGGKKASS